MTVWPLCSEEKKKKWSRHRTNYDESDVTYINERNRRFNARVERVLKDYIAPVRESLERGSAV